MDLVEQNTVFVKRVHLKCVLNLWGPLFGEFSLHSEQHCLFICLDRVRHGLMKHDCVFTNETIVHGCHFDSKLLVARVRWILLKLYVMHIDESIFGVVHEARPFEQSKTAFEDYVDESGC